MDSENDVGVAAVASSLSLAQSISLACLLEATSPKAGNVHRAADFANLCFTDFAVAAIGIGPAMERAIDDGAATGKVGRAALAAVRSMNELTMRNTSLGTILLLAPLAAIPREQTIESGIGAVLGELTHGDATDVYQAIQEAQPGGMGEVSEMDVAGPAPESLLDAMRAAAEYDLVARQYVNQFDDVLRFSVPELVRIRTSGVDLISAIVELQLVWLAREPDSLIQRKCGQVIAQEASNRAAHVLSARGGGSEAFYESLANFDFWLRSDGHRRNPGTTADLIAATLFATIRDGLISPPFR